MMLSLCEFSVINDAHDVLESAYRLQGCKLCLLFSSFLPHTTGHTVLEMAAKCICHPLSLDCSTMRRLRVILTH